MAWKHKTFKFIAAGMNTATPQDLKPEGKQYNALINVRVRKIGEIRPRPGLAKFNAASSPGSRIETVRKFGYFGGDQIIVVHAGNSIGTMGAATAWNALSTSGWNSGENASIILWRPNRQGEKWAYVYGNEKQIKFPRTAATSGDVENIGISAPGKSDTVPYDITPSDPPTVAAGTGTPGPTGVYQYAYRYRSSVTGVVSDISDLSLEITSNNLEIDLSVLLASADTQVDFIDIYRIGGTLEDLTFVDSVANGVTTYTDAKTDADIVANDSLPVAVNSKPWVTTDSLGVTNAGTPLPHVWGPFHDRLLACGASDQPGTLFWSNANDPDSQDPDNYIEVTGVNEPLIKGFLFNESCFVFTNDSLYSIYPELTGLNLFRPQKTDCSRGAISSDCIAVGDRIYFLAEDGVFATRGAAEIALSTDIYNMFAHEGATGEPEDSIETMSLPEFNVGSVNPNFTSLTYDSGYLRLHFKNKAGNTSMLVYDFILGGWLFDDYQGKDITMVYGMEGETQVSGRNWGATEVLVGTNAGQIYKMQAGTDDDGQSIACGLVTHYHDDGDPRANKRFGDLELDFDPDGVAVTVTPRLDDGTTVLTGEVLGTTAGRQKAIIDINDGYGQWAKNLGIAISWTISGTDNSRKGPWLYGWSPSHTIKPEDSNERAIEWHNITDDVSDGYVWGVEMDIDTQGATVTFEVWADNVNTGITFNVNSGTPNVADPTSSENITRHVWVNNHFYAKKVRLVPTGNSNDIRIFNHSWLFYKEPPDVTDWDSNWAKPLSECETGYVTGVRIEFDSANAAQTFVLQGEMDGTVTSYTAREGNSETHDGRKTAYFTFDEPFRANLVRAYTTGGTAIRVYGICWTAHPEPPKLGNWDSTYEDFGSPKVLKGVEIFVDTINQDKTVEVQLDQSVHETITVNSNGRQGVTVAFTRDGNGEYPRAVTARLFPTDNEPVFLYRIRWIMADEPEQVSNFNPTWTEDGYAGAKFLQGVRILADTKGQEKDIVVDYDAGATTSSYTINHAIRDTKVITFTPPFITHSMRLRSTDADEGFLYNVDWIWNKAPDLAEDWQTQDTTFGASGWMHIRRGFLAVSDGSGTITLRFTLDDGTVIDKTFTAPGSGNYAKFEYTMPANKFKAVDIRVFSVGNPFRLYKNDCETLVKHWGSTEGYKTVRPFGDEHFDKGATI